MAILAAIFETVSLSLYNSVPTNSLTSKVEKKFPVRADWMLYIYLCKKFHTDDSVESSILYADVDDLFWGANDKITFEY